MGKNGQKLQYHPRSDRHSKVACWGLMFDLMLASDVLRRKVEAGAVTFGINHEMSDFKNNRKKNLDLVLCVPRHGEPASDTTFADLAKRYQINLNEAEKKALMGLPSLQAAPVGSVQIALEAKACMTEHLKARPRLYDELNSSHQTIHGASEVAIAAGFSMVNIAEQFRSPGRSEVTKHRQPDVTERVIEKLKELPRRSKQNDEGFDALAIVVVDCPNDGSEVRLWSDPPAPPRGDIFHYETMVQRLAQAYDSRFSG
jgi:hypothetical protein